MIYALALLAALSGPPAWAVNDKDTFTLAEVGEITSLDPAFPYDNSSQGLILNVYDTLIAFDRDSLEKFVPMLSTKVPSSKDGLTYRFPIRKDVRFHDGSLMTPEDVRYSLLRFMLTDRAGGPSALLLEPILGITSTRDSAGKATLSFAAAAKAVQVEGDDVVIRLPRPFAPFLSIMARWSYVCSKSWAVAHGEWDGTAETWAKFNNPTRETSYFYEHMNGTGPFKLERWDKTGKYALLSRNEAYWRGPAALRRVLVKCVPEFATRKLMLQAGDADAIETPRPFASQLDGMRGVRVADGLARLQTDPALYFTFKINPEGNPDIGSGKLDGDGIPPDFFADPDVRKGFAYAFDYDALLRDTFKGKAQRAKGPIPPGITGYDADQPFYKHDLRQAEAHFWRAWKGQVWEKGFHFTVTYNVGSQNREAACQILKKNVESISPKFKVDLRGVEWANFLAKQQRRMMPLFSIGWSGDYPDAHNFVYAFYHTNGRYPSAQGYSNKELDVLIETAAGEVNTKKRKDLYRRILKIGFDEVPSIVTVHPTGVYGMRDNVKGFYDNPVFLDIYFYPLSKL